MCSRSKLRWGRRRRSLGWLPSLNTRIAVQARQCDTPRHPPPDVCFAQWVTCRKHLVAPPGKQEAGGGALEESPAERIKEPSGGFGVLVNGALGDLGKGFVSRLLFLQCLLQKRHGVFKAKLFRPSDERPVAGDFVMLYRLRGGQEARIQRGRAF